jgi:hypothetical protein
MSTVLARPPWLILEPRDRYDRRTATHLNSHSLATFMKCPRLYSLGQSPPMWKQEPQSVLVGRAFHCLVLEGEEAFDRQFIVGGPLNPRTGTPFGRTTKAFKQWLEEEGKDALDEETAALLSSLKVGLMSSPHAMELLSSGFGESTVLGTINGLPCQSRIDWVRWTGDPSEAVIVDLKTCGDLDEFESNSIQYGYHRQLAFYRLVAESSSGLVLPCMLIGIEKRSPNRCGVWRLDDSLLLKAVKDVKVAISAMQECRRLDHWPTGYESPRLLTA